MTHRARAIAPGEVVVLSAETSRPAERVGGTSPAGEIPFASTGDGRVWEALVGLDLEAPKGPLRLVVRAEGAGSGPSTSTR